VIKLTATALFDGPPFGALASKARPLQVVDCEPSQTSHHRQHDAKGNPGHRGAIPHHPVPVLQQSPRCRQCSNVPVNRKGLRWRCPKFTAAWCPSGVAVKCKCHR